MTLFKNVSRHFLSPLLIAGLLCTTLSCSDDEAATGQNNAWEVGDDDLGSLGNNAPTATDMGRLPFDAGTSPVSFVDAGPDMRGPIDAGSPQSDVGLPPIDAGASASDAGAPDMSPPVPDMMTLPDAGPNGECQANSQCGSGAICCPFGGGASGSRCTPENQCVGGGLCVSDTDCPNTGEECCDLSQFGVTEKICTDRCPSSGGGNNPPACQNNNECMGANQVCCPAFDGSTSCLPRTQCNTGGGLCAVDSECGNNEQCCTFGQFGICRDQCGF